MTMGVAVCIKCGAYKGSPFQRCPDCGFSPEGDHLAMAQSLILSTAYYDEDRDYIPTKQELSDASTIIKSGGTIDWDKSKLARFVDEQNILERAGSPSWLRVVLLLLMLILILNVIPLVALIVFLIRKFL